MDVHGSGLSNQTSKQIMENQATMPDITKDAFFPGGVLHHRTGVWRDLARFSCRVCVIYIIYALEAIGPLFLTENMRHL